MISSCGTRKELWANWLVIEFTEKSKQLFRFNDWINLVKYTYLNKCEIRSLNNLASIDSGTNQSHWRSGIANHMNMTLTDTRQRLSKKEE